MDQLASRKQLVSASSRRESSRGFPDDETSIPWRARLHVFLNRLPLVFSYNARHVNEQGLLFLAVASLAGKALRELLLELTAREILRDYDVFIKFLLPCTCMLGIWLAQEQLALQSYGKLDPLTRKVRWHSLSTRFRVTLPGTQQPSIKDEEVETTESDDLASREDGDSMGAFEKSQKRTFTVQQEASIKQLEDRYFDRTSKTWAKSRLICVNDDTRYAAIRALDARKWRVDQAATLIENNLKWREKEDIDNIFLKIIPDKDVRSVRCAMGDGFYGLDRTGMPIYWCPAGTINLATLRNSVPLENIVATHVQLMEYNQRVYFRDISRSQGRCVYQSTCVLDLKGFSSQSTSKGFWDCMQAITAIDKDYYYENLFRVYILHAPMVFRFFWSTVSQMLQPETRQKFVFLSDVAGLRLYIEPDVIPVQFGGDNKGKDTLFTPESDGTKHTKALDAFLLEYRAGKIKDS